MSDKQFQTENNEKTKDFSSPFTYMMDCVGKCVGLEPCLNPIIDQFCFKSNFIKSTVNCLAECYLNPRHWNCVVFPGTSRSGKTNDKVKKYIFENKYGEEVPYLEISSEKSLEKKEVILFFHGNAENIHEARQMIEPVFDKLNITTLIIEYPGYGDYSTPWAYNTSDKIKSNTEEFFYCVKKRYNVSKENIYIIGRSIGTGPASYLSSKIKNPKLALISPFDSITSLAKSYCSLLGGLFYEHFDNMKSVSKMQGDLLVIHGEKDEMINIKHGENVVESYEKSCYSNKCIFERRKYMSHNFYDQEDVTEPIVKFLTDKY